MHGGGRSRHRTCLSTESWNKWEIDGIFAVLSPVKVSPDADRQVSNCPQLVGIWAIGAVAQSRQFRPDYWQPIMHDSRPASVSRALNLLTLRLRRFRVACRSVLEGEHDMRDSGRHRPRGY